MRDICKVDSLQSCFSFKQPGIPESLASLEHSSRLETVNRTDKTLPFALQKLLTEHRQKQLEKEMKFKGCGV